MNQRMLFLIAFCFQTEVAQASTIWPILTSRESDPLSLVENVSTIHGDYTDVEIDLIVPAPDSLVLARVYSSKDSTQTTNLGGWRLNPHCFLLRKKDPNGKTFTSGPDTFECTHVLLATPEGSILPYTGWICTSSKNNTQFKIEDEKALGLTNTAKGDISAWTNVQNNSLEYDAQKDRFELTLSSGGKRFYAKHPSLDLYLLQVEVLPSGNKILYEFDSQGRLTFMQETESQEKKLLGWIRIEYGEEVHVSTSDGKGVKYYFHQDLSCLPLLSHVIRSDKPPVHYTYRIVDAQALLTREIA